MQIAQQLKLINAKKPSMKPSVRSHAPVWGVPVGAAAFKAVKKLRTLKKPPDRPPIAKALKPLVPAPGIEATSSTDTPPPAPVEECAIVPWTEIVPRCLLRCPCLLRLAVPGPKPKSDLIPTRPTSLVAPGLREESLRLTVYIGCAPTSLSPYPWRRFSEVFGIVSRAAPLSRMEQRLLRDNRESCQGSRPP